MRTLQLSSANRAAEMEPRAGIFAVSLPTGGPGAGRARRTIRVSRRARHRSAVRGRHRPSSTRHLDGGARRLPWSPARLRACWSARACARLSRSWHRRWARPSRTLPEQRSERRRPASWSRQRLSRLAMSRTSRYPAPSPSSEIHRRSWPSRVARSPVRAEPVSLGTCPHDQRAGCPRSRSRTRTT